MRDDALLTLKCWWQFVLDASPSFDPDFVPETAGEVDTALTVAWECVVELSGRRQSCSDKNGSPLVLPQNPILTIASETLAPLDAAYQFTVTVSKASRIPRAFTMPV